MKDPRNPPQRKDRRPTIRDVAALAGVSPATVSNTLSGLRGVTPDRRRAVLDAVAALDYKSNHMASSLRRGQTRTVGIVVPDLGNALFAELVREWEKLVPQSGFEMMVVASGENPETEALRIQSLIGRSIDGLLVVAADDDFGSAEKFPADLPPTVLVDRAFGHAHFDTVASDNFDAVYRGSQHLLELGHRDITLLTSSTNHAHLKDRVAAYRRALSEAGCEDRERIVFGGPTIEGCRSAIEQDLRRGDRPTAIFAATYFATVGAVKAITALDIDFPTEISLLGFEDSEWTTALRPYLSTVRQSPVDLARHSWAALLERIADESAPPQRKMLEFEFIYRESTQPIVAPADATTPAARAVVT